MSRTIFPGRNYASIVTQKRTFKRNNTFDFFPFFVGSSAFMSLAARFPLRSSSNYKTCPEESTSLVINEPQVIIVEPEENEKLDEKISDQSVCELNSMTIDIIEHSEEREVVDWNNSCRTNGGLIGVADESNSKLLESAQRHNSEHSPVESGAISAVTGEGPKNLCHGSLGKELDRKSVV